MNKYIKSIGVDAILAAAFYLWQVRGIEGAGNVFSFVIWAMIAVWLLAGFVGDKTFFTPKPKALVVYNTAVFFVTLLTLAYIGNFWQAGLFFFSFPVLNSAKCREPKKAKQ